MAIPRSQNGPAAKGVALKISVYVYESELVHNMHDAKRNRTKIDADNIKPEDGTFRAAISSANNERTSLLLVRVTLLAFLRCFERHTVSMLWFQGRLGNVGWGHLLGRG